MVVFQIITKEHTTKGKLFVNRMWKHKKRNENKGKDTLHFVIIKRTKPKQETIDKGVKVLKPNSSVKYYPVQWF